MAKSPDELMAMRFGGASVAENLKRAIDAGALTEAEDGSLMVVKGRDSGAWTMVPNGPPLGCDFLMRVLFYGAYAQSTVPFGCQACYKVKVVPRTLRELVAAWGIGKRTECLSKWGTDLNNRYSQNIYAGYFYASGLDMARAIFRVAREAIDNDPKLGPGVAMSIKRGCSSYEDAVGPSDKYEFAPELSELEAYLKTKYAGSRKAVALPPVPLAHWIDVAFRIGDDTYLDFTGGQPIHAKTVTYDPGHP